MPASKVDSRSDSRLASDEQIASEPCLPSPDLSPDAVPLPMEDHLRRESRRPLALPGIVENGVIRLIDHDVTLPERSRVIVVAEGT